jgi:flagellar M-ring protein FliF
MTRHVKLPQGTIKRLSIAVLVDQAVQWQGKPPQQQRVLVPPTPEKLKTIHDLVATAVGFTAARGDQLTVETLPFDSTLNAAPPVPDLPAPPKGKKPPATLLEQLKENPLLMWGAIGAGAVILLLLVLVLFRGKGVKNVRVAETPALPAATTADREAVPVSAAGRETVNINANPAPTAGAFQLPASRVDVIVTQLRESATTNADAWAQVLRSWVAEEERG